MIDETPIEVQIVSRSADTEDAAAVTSVLRAALTEVALNEADNRVTVSAWQSSQRPVREPVIPGPGAWRNFSG
ncbi:MAG: acyl-CoA carboxylase subunit epsilon [Salinibacterium sp.]|nr:MAG: acyl-CoA carboxylase subunit epsilon [Salinibacterium sp.]